MDKRRGKSPGEAPPQPQSDDAPRDPVGDRLRAMFEAVESAPVPDEINRLVAELEKKRVGRAPRRN